jgi:hypothetical protein
MKIAPGGVFVMTRQMLFSFTPEFFASPKSFLFWAYILRSLPHLKNLQERQDLLITPVQRI